MKFTFKTIAIAAMVAMSTLSFAGKKGNKSDKAVSPELDVRIIAVEKSSVAVLFNKLEGEEVAVKIYDAQGRLVYQEKETAGTTFSKKYILSELPSGNYAYLVSNELYTVKKVIYND